MFAPGAPPPAEPLVLRGIVRHWPVVQAASEGPGAVLALLRGYGGAQELDFAILPPAQQGRFHYAPDLRGFNFARNSASLGELLNRIEAEWHSPTGAAIAAQGVIAREVTPAFAQSHPLPLLPGPGEARLWIGTRAQVAAHSDPAPNLAYCTAGRRRFTLYPPEQVGNLYMGPFDPTPAGTPIAMTDPLHPDPARYPRFAAACEAAWIAELEPGDAVYVPYGWFHHVEALDPVSMLVNYWWPAPAMTPASAWDAMLHGMLALRPLSAEARRHWAAMFAHYVFEADGPAGEHLPPPARGVLGARGAADLAAMQRMLIASLTRRP
ncbi:cupin-like domain-containing protein [Novosphingobium sp. B 225]|uniref:cupin-like domain-containing protein n=1 Tax=Novosphingobium sp. B 225 TaxID=1961849 RepID=UPI001595BDF7|nr:cupin-like domain-containing protein [Novosphingobium sp. B 225]